MILIIQKIHFKCQNIIFKEIKDEKEIIFINTAS